MFNKFKKIFLSKQQNEETDRYIEVPKSAMNEDLKRHIFELEKLGEECSMLIENEYKNKYEDAYAYYIQLWYYFSGGRKGVGTLYDSSKYDLETDIKDRLEEVLKEI